MAYQEPGMTTTIIEQGENPVGGPESLTTCMVGPGLQVEVKADAGVYDYDSTATYEMPDLMEQAEVIYDSDTGLSVHVYITNSTDGETYELDFEDGYWSYDADEEELTVASHLNVQLASGDASDTTSSGYVFTDTDFDFSTIDLKNGAGTLGDYLVVSGIEYKVAGLASDGTSLLLETEVSIAGHDWTLIRHLDGELYVSYYALRTDIVGDLLYFTSPSDVTTQAGGSQAIIPENPLFYGAYLATSEGSGCYATGVDDSDGYIRAYFDGGDEDDLVAWQAAFTYLKQFDYLYSFVILSQHNSVIGASQTFVDWMSLPANNKEAVAWCSIERTSEEIMVEVREASSGLSGSTWTDTGVNFTTQGVLPGHYLEIIEDGVGTAHRIKTVAANALTLYEAPDATSEKTYRVVGNYFNASEEANYYKEYAEAIADKRVRIAWPATCSIGGGTTEYPSYYIYCSRAGKITAEPNPSTPYTRDALATISRVYPYTRDNTLYNIIASGGIEIFMQDKTALPVYSRHQLTTDMTVDARKEQSVVHQVDYSAKDIRASIEPKIGRRLTQNLLNSLATIISLRGNYLRNKKQCISNLKLLELSVSEEDNTRVNLSVQLTPLYLFNGADIIIYVY